MRLARLRVRLGSTLPLLALGLLAAWPIIRYGPHGSVDSPNHFFRLVELAWHVRHGDLYPRWFADVYSGFGAPVLNFYSPLSYYISMLFNLAGISLVSAYSLSFVAAIVAGLFGMVGWARDQFGSATAGLVAGAAYAFSPYLYYNALIRGSHPELWALGIAPWLFWSAHRLITRATRGAYVAYTLLYAALCLTHIHSAALFTPLLALYAVALAVEQRRNGLGMASLGTLHGLGLAAVFLLPAWLESQYVGLQRAGIDYREHFLSLRDLLSPPVPFDPNLVRNLFPISLPWPQLALAAMAVAAVIGAMLRREKHWLAVTTIVFAVTTIALAVLTLPLSERLWQAVPFARFVQFPWRLLGPASLMLAWLAAGGLPGGKFQRLAGLGAIVVFFLYSMTWTYRHPPEELLPSAADGPAAVLQYEMEHPEATGTTYQNEFLPRWVSQLPAPETLLARYAANPVPSRLAGLPDGAQLVSQKTGLTSTEITIKSATPMHLEFDLFYFPGWAARLDGEAWPIAPAKGTGQIVVEVPAGQHTLLLHREITASQWAGTAISMVLLVALALAYGLRRKVNVALPAPVPDAESLAPGLALLFVTLLGLRALVLDRIENPFYFTRLDSLPNPSNVDYFDSLALIGREPWPSGQFVSGEPIDTTLYWQMLDPRGSEWHVSLQLADAHGNRWGQSDQFPGLIPTTLWREGQYVRDMHRVTAFAGTPPGVYHFAVRVYFIVEGQVYPVSPDVDGQFLGGDFEIGPITLLRGPAGPPGPLKILQASLAAESVSVGDGVPFTVLWTSGEAPASSLALRADFVDSGGREVYSTQFAPAGPDYPSEIWMANELIRYPHSLILPPDLPAGPLDVTLTFVNADGSAAAVPFDLGTITVTVPDRSYAIPAIEHRVDHDFGRAIRLLGYDWTADGLALYWQSLAPVSKRLTVFLHLYDAAGEFVEGHDAPPLRPTTSWLPGEVIRDEWQIPVYGPIEIGLYDPATGERLGEPIEIRR